MKDAKKAAGNAIKLLKSYGVNKAQTIATIANFGKKIFDTAHHLYNNSENIAKNLSNSFDVSLKTTSSILKRPLTEIEKEEMNFGKEQLLNFSNKFTQMKPKIEASDDFKTFAKSRNLINKCSNAIIKKVRNEKLKTAAISATVATGVVGTAVHLLTKPSKSDNEA